MAVEQRKAVEYRGFSGFEEPQFPTGYHRTEGAMIGDGTGGDQVLLFDFALATEQRNSQYYSLEELSITRFNSGSVTAEMEVVNFDSSVTTRYSLVLTPNQVAFACLRIDDAQQIHGLFLGRQASPSGNMSVSFSHDNTDTILTRVLIGGYVWSARSTNVPGGPQRPPTGLYRP